MFTYPKGYDVIVIGAGHAGCEAALAAARMGCTVLLLTHNLDTIAQMSCNPAIGGIAKGHLVREIDALGGEMARNIDKTGIQFKMLNKKKGPAVWASRAQADKKAYQLEMKSTLESQPRLDIKQESVVELLVEGTKACGVCCATGNRYKSRAVILTTGTFLDGIIHIGEKSFVGGRAGEQTSKALAKNIQKLGFETSRLKTGTPPRINSIGADFSVMVRQDGDAPPVPFSFSTKKIDIAQIPCFITKTTEDTNRIVKENLHRSPLYGGKIRATGVRYCPSIEDKVVKFPERSSHQVFIEPEGINTREAYLNGVSTSMPYDVQIGIVRSIVGLEKAEIIRPGYAVEYDFILPTQLAPTLETKKIGNLYLAGQINGTSGYEEAAAQGLMAGINAALRVMERDPLVLDRSEAYIGVLIDDLVTKGTREPYRMFTSRAEYRLLLRQDNADVRLMPYGGTIGLVPAEKMRQLDEKKALVVEGIRRAREMRCGNYTIEQLLRRPDASYRKLRSEVAHDLPEYANEVVEQIEIEIKYAGYIKRQLEDVQRFKKMEGRMIPLSVDFTQMRGLKKEAIEKLQRVRPTSVGQAARISGITPADISILMIWLEREMRLSSVT